MTSSEAGGGASRVKTGREPEQEEGIPGRAGPGQKDRWWVGGHSKYKECQQVGAARKTFLILP